MNTRSDRLSFSSTIPSLFAGFVLAAFLGGSANAQTSAVNALGTDGVDDFAYPLTPNASGLGEGTIEFWFSADRWTSTNNMWGGGNGLPGSNGDWARIGSHTSSGSMALAFGKFAGSWNWASSGVEPDSAAWHHVAATWGSGLNIFIDGVLTGQNFSVASIGTYPTELIAASSWGDYFEGAIDEVRIWDHNRDSVQIARTAGDTLGPEYYATVDSGLVAYYRMDELEDLGVNGDGSDDLRDLSVNANHADTEGDPMLEASGALVVTSVDHEQPELPGEFGLNQNYPNPFNPTTTIEFSIPRNEFVTLTILNLLGEKVVRLVEEKRPAGNHSVQWDAGSFPSGIYFYRIEAGGIVETKKLVFLK